MTEANHDQFEFWETLAPDWLASEDHTELVSGAFGVAAMDRLGLPRGARVIDIGCGSGATTLALAEVVGPDGEAVGVDIAPGMVAAAREHAAAAGVEHARFRTADAQVDDLGDAVFDAAYSRFGVMFFADPAAAFANIRSSMKPGAPLAFACWANVFANEWMFVPGSAVVAVTGALPPMPGPGEPGPFSLEDPDRLDPLLRAAGFTQVDITPHQETITIPVAQLESLVALSRRVGPVREALRTADDDTVSAIVEAVRDALTSRVEHDVLRLGAAGLVVSARA
jgi:SAM-dependent methyltransferase